MRNRERGKWFLNDFYFIFISFDNLIIYLNIIKISIVTVGLRSKQVWCMLVKWSWDQELWGCILKSVPDKSTANQPCVHDGPFNVQSPAFANDNDSCPCCSVYRVSFTVNIIENYSRYISIIHESFMSWFYNNFR